MARLTVLDPPANAKIGPLAVFQDHSSPPLRYGGRPRVEGAPRCATEFAKGCTTQRDAVLDHQGHTRGDCMIREQRWLARVPAGAPGLLRAELPDVTVPRPDGREELVEGAEVTGRHGGGWLRRTPARVRGGLDVVLMLAGMLGAIVHQFASGTAWPGIVAGLLAGGFGVLIWRSHRHRAAHA
jgi:hypothetical protein